MAKILHLIPTLEGGGAERQVAYLATALHQRGWDVTVASLRRGVNAGMLEEAGVKLLPIKSARSRDPLLFLRVPRLVHEIGPDLIHTWVPAMDILGGFSASLLRVPWVASERYQPDAWPPGIRTWSRQRLILRTANVVVTNSEKAAATYKSLGAREGSIRCVPNGVPLERLRTADPADRSGLGVGEGTRLLVVVGRPDPQKNIETIIRALPRVMERIPVLLLVFGIGPGRAKLEALVRDLGLERNVRFEGYSEASPAWLRSADLFVSASHFEGNPNVVMEAMACGSPMVLSDIQEHRELAGDGALYFTATDQDELADSVVSALSQSEAAGARVRMASGLIEARSVGTMVERYEAIYTTLLDGMRR
jgi:glycosyltransferase involved in cell wall biosynthesis